MGTGTLTSRSTGETITASFFNDFNNALAGNVVGRDSSTLAATSGQGLGSASIPWGTGYFNSIVLGGDALDASQITSPANRIVSGSTRPSSNQPFFLDPHGSAATVTITGNTTNLVFDVNGSSVTCSTDIAITGLTTAPGSNNTCLVNESAAADQEWTRYKGERPSQYIGWKWNIGTDTTDGYNSNFNAKNDAIDIDNIGSEITSLNDKVCAFKLEDGSGGTEYFIGIPRSSNAITDVRRGYFLDNAGLPINRIKFANNDTITLMKLGWIFLTNDGTTADVTYNNPVWDDDEPGSPSTGDYWYDLSVSEWKRYSGSAFVSINRTLLGVCIIDTSNCVAARSFDFYYNRKETNTFIPYRSSATNVRAYFPHSQIYVYSKNFDFGFQLIDFNITVDLASTATKDAYLAETASTYYYLYITDTGDVKMSDIGPYYSPELFGDYHPHNPWRCVGVTFNDASSNLINLAAPFIPLNWNTEIPTAKSTVAACYIASDASMPKTTGQISCSKLGTGQFRFTMGSALGAGGTFSMEGGVVCNAITTADNNSVTDWKCAINLYGNALRYDVTITNSANGFEDGACSFVCAATDDDYRAITNQYQSIAKAQDT